MAISNVSIKIISSINNIDKNMLISYFNTNHNKDLYVNIEDNYFQYYVTDSNEKYDTEPYFYQIINLISDIDRLSFYCIKNNLEIQIKVNIIHCCGDYYPGIVFSNEFCSFCSKLNAELYIDTIVTNTENPIEPEILLKNTKGDIVKCTLYKLNDGLMYWNSDDELY